MTAGDVYLIGSVAIFNAFIDDDDDDRIYDADDFGIIAIALAIGHRRIRAKVPTYVESIVPEYTELQFKTFFRISRQTCQQLIRVFSQRPEFQPSGHSGGRPAISLEKKILMTLWYLGSQEMIRSIADRFNVSESTFCKHQRLVISAICDISPLFIKWPERRELRRLSTEFQERHGFPGVIGAVDSTHVRIESPVNHSDDYYNRKGYYSINLQAVCRADRRYTDVYCGWPGKVHDARVFRNSPLFDKGAGLCGEQHHILGDGAYPLNTWTLTPYRNNGHLTRDQRKYNKIHSATRVVIENCFGMTKGRFRRLKNIVVRDIEFIVRIIISACTLHNICIVNNDEIDDIFNEKPTLDVDEEAPMVACLGNRASIRKRAHITNLLAQIGPR